MRVAVLGATGNVGTAVLRRLQAARTERPGGLEIVGVARRVPAQATGPYEGVQWHSIDVAARSGTEDLTRGAARSGCRDPPGVGHPAEP